MNLFAQPVGLAIAWATDDGLCVDCGATVSGLHLSEIVQRPDQSFGRYCLECGKMRCTEAAENLITMLAVEV